MISPSFRFNSRMVWTMLLSLTTASKLKGLYWLAERFQPRASMQSGSSRPSVSLSRSS